MTHNNHNGGLGAPPIPRQNYETRLAGWAIGAIFTALITWPIITAISAFPTLAPSAVRRRALSGEPSRHPRMNALSIALWRSGIFMLISAFIPVLLLVTAPASVIIAGQAVGAKAGEPITVANVFNGIKQRRHTRTARNGGAFAGILALAAVVAWIVAATTRGLGGALYFVLGTAAVLVLAYTAVILATQAVTEAVSAAHDSRTRLELVTERIAGALGVNPRVLAEQHAVEARADGSWVVSPAPVSAVNAGLAKVEEAVGRFFPELTVVAYDHSVVAAGIATPDVLDARAAVAESNGLVTGFEDVEDSELRPEHAIWHLADGVSPAAAEKVSAFARKRGLALVEWLPYDGVAHVAKLPSLTQQIRDVVSASLGARPWDVELTVEASADRAVETVRIHRMPQLQAAKRQAAWLEALALIPGGHADWIVTDDGRTATLTFAPIRELPALVPLAELAPKTAGEAAQWYRLPIGRDDRGADVCIDLKLGPHALTVGQTGTGKTIEMLAHAVAALLRGHDLIIVDPMKGGVDFTAVLPWTRHVSRELDDAAATLAAAYAEGQRRKAVLLREGVGSWADVTAAVQDSEGLKPLTVIIDEFVSLIEPEEEPKGLDKDHPLLTEAQAKNASKAILGSLVRKAARELRFVGIFLVVAAQRPDAKFLAGEFRSNLTSRTQLAKPGDALSREALAMVFSAEQVGKAFGELAALDDGKSRGLAVVGAEGGNVRGFRVAYASNAEIATLLANVPTPAPFVVPPLDLDGGGTDSDGGSDFSIDLSDL